MRCYIGLDALYFVKYLQDGSYENTRIDSIESITAMRCYIGFDTLYFVKYLQQSTESPIFDASFWSENGVSSSHERNKIGDSVL